MSLYELAQVLHEFTKGKYKLNLFLWNLPKLSDAKIKWLRYLGYEYTYLSIFKFKAFLAIEEYTNKRFA